MDKAQLRRQMKARLQDMTDSQRLAKSCRACSHLVETSVFQEADVIMMFLSLPEEVDTTEAVETAWRLGKTVVVPKISWTDRQMEAVILLSLQDDLLQEQMGLRTPVQAAVMPNDQIDLVVTPGLAFDDQGRRLGRGGAFYDQFLSRPELQATCYGLVYADQMVAVVPTADHDQRVDGVITDERVYRSGT